METPRDPHSSSDFSNFETESVHHTDKEIQADLDHTSNLEESEFSYQGGISEFKEMQAGIEFAVQITPLKNTKKHREKMDPARDTPASSYIPDDVMETLNNKNPADRLAVTTQRGTSGLLPETSSRMAEISSLEGMGQLPIRQITAVDVDLEKIKLDGAMTRMRYRHEENEKKRRHEEKMERIRHQAISQSNNSFQEYMTAKPYTVKLLHLKLLMGHLKQPFDF
uniref:Uncharacterized protein n=1 Tax=Sphaerodactylus townsendi TaxID=933632 RepID=A0ACB8GA07_9SAUR